MRHPAIPQRTQTREILQALNPHADLQAAKAHSTFSGRARQLNDPARVQSRAPQKPAQSLCQVDPLRPRPVLESGSRATIWNKKMPQRPTRQPDKVRKELEQFCGRKGVRMTPQRREVVEALLRTRDHVSADQLVDALRRAGRVISKATVYRTLALLKDSGLFDAHDFGTGARLYEPIADRPHHDHMCCVSCGRITEFSHPTIEKLQDQIARRHRFQIVYHVHKLFGYCSRCQRRE